MKTRKMVTIVSIPVAAIVLAAAAAAATATDVQVNAPQVAGDPTSDDTAVFPTNKQNEPTVAVNPTDNRLLVAGSNDEQKQPPCGPGPVRGPAAAPSDCSFFPGVGTSGIYTSSNGGTSWINRGLLDDQPSWQHAGLVSDGDPVLVYGPKPAPGGGYSYAHGARAYYATLASYKDGQSNAPDNKAPGLLAVSWSDDNGVTWSAPVLGSTKRNPNDFNDKESIWVDDLPTSPYFGRVYLSWTEFRAAGTAEPVDVAVSTNGGLSFSAPKQLSPAGNNGNGNGRQGSAVRTGPDGSVYVAFEQANAQVVAVSRDGGGSWGRPVTVGKATDIDNPIPGSNFRTDSFPSIAADPRADSKTLYVAWADRAAGGGRMVVSTSGDRGLHWSAPTTVSTAGNGYAFFQGLDVAPTGRVDLGFQALKATDAATFGTGNAKIDSFYASKPANGTWSVPARVTTASSDPAASAQNNLQMQFWGDYNTLVSGSSKAWFIYTDARHGLGCPAVDRYQDFLVTSGALIEEDEASVVEKKPATEPGDEPAPQAECPDQFGNSDAFVSVVTP